MNLTFENKVALVTGAGSGMGLVAAQAFVAEGAAVALVDINESAVRTAAERLLHNKESMRLWKHGSGYDLDGLDYIINLRGEHYLRQ